MKSILYVGASLMVAASIYGFVDYKQSHQKKEFKGMYSEKKTTPVVTTEVEVKEPVVTDEPVKETKKAVTNVTKKRAVKKQQDEVVLPVIKPIPADQKLKSDHADVTLDDDVTVVPAKENKVIKTKKKRKISAKLFSRAPLREDYDDEEVIAPVKKKETKKLEIKE